MSDLSHDEVAEELAGVALGSASTHAADRVRAHARNCAECRNEMERLESTTQQLSALIPEHPINPGRAAGIRSRLVSRAGADTDKRAIAVSSSAASRVKLPLASKAPAPPVARVRERDLSSESTQRNGLSQSPLALVTGLLFLVASAAVIQMLRIKSEADSLRATIQVQPEAVASEPVPAVAAFDHDKIVAAVTGSDVKIIPLTHYGARGAVARMFWNRESNTWTLVAYSIRQPKPEKVFQVWLVTATGTLSAGTFVPDGNGKALVQSVTSVPRESLYSITVTEEPKGGAPVPSGPAVIAGAP